MNRDESTIELPHVPPGSPQRVTANDALGVALAFHRQGDLGKASDTYEKILAVVPEHLDSLRLCGVLCYQRGELDRAAVLLHRAVALEPRFADAYCNLATVLEAQGHQQAAIDVCQQALAIEPRHVGAWNNLGSVLAASGRWSDAIKALAEAVRIEPSHSDAWSNLAAARHARGETSAAIEAAQHAVRLAPQLPVHRARLGLALESAGRVAEARDALAHAVEIDPQNGQNQFNLAHVCDVARDWDAALEHYQTALELDPDNALALAQTLHTKRALCDWAGTDQLSSRIREVLRNRIHGITPFSFLSEDGSPEEQLRCAQLWAEQIETRARPYQDQIGSFATTGNDGPVTIGYVSSGFRRHPTAALTVELFESHDRGRFRSIAYSTGPDDGSELRLRIQRSVDEFVDVSGWHFADIARRVVADKVDILVDLRGYGGGAVSELFALRPAPVQVNFLAYPGTMGADFMDYLIADHFVIPTRQISSYAESVAYLPDCYQPNDSRREISSRQLSRTECDLPEGGFVFCCFNNSYKISPDVFDDWMLILQAVPGSVLWLLDVNPASTLRQHLQTEAKRRDVDPERLVFMVKLPQADYLARYRHVDLFLDTRPYNAHTTASDALWAGCPVLTLAGDTFASRVAGSLLKAAGLPELVMHTREAYREKAIELASKPDQLTQLRERLAKNRTSAPLFDTQRFARHLESAYLTMHESRAMDDEPRSFSVVPEHEAPGS